MTDPDVIRRVGELASRLRWATLAYAVKLTYPGLPAEARNEALEGDLQALVEAVKWRPIEEHDGTEAPVLVAEGRAVGEAYLNADGHGWYWAGHHWTDATDGQCYPTRWMPLPLPPAPGGENG